MIFACHMTLKDHVIRVLCNFRVRNPCGHRHFVSGDIIVLVCHVIL